MRVAALVSGGKDSALALHRVLQKNYDVAFLVAMIPKRDDSWMFHYPNIHLVDLFAEAIGTPLIKKPTSGVKERELKDLRDVLAELEVDGVVSGAVSSQYQRRRIMKICEETNLKSITPLWEEDPLTLLKELVSSKFEVVITGVFAYGFDVSWLGRLVDANAMRDLKALHNKYHVSLVGEGGEYESFVCDAPFFKKRICFVETEKVWKHERGILHVKRASLIDKRS